MGTSVKTWPAEVTLRPKVEKVKRYQSEWADTQKNLHWRLVDHSMTDEVCTEVWQARQLRGV